MKGQNKFLIAATFSLLSFGVIAGEAYTCELDAKKSKGWIPSKIAISFNDDKQITRLYAPDYVDYDLDKVKVLRYTKDFREVQYKEFLDNVDGAARTTLHTITILPKLNNKIVYVMKFLNFSNHYNARGRCKKN